MSLPSDCICQHEPGDHLLDGSCSQCPCERYRKANDGSRMSQSVLQEVVKTAAGLPPKTADEWTKVLANLSAKLSKAPHDRIRWSRVAAVAIAAMKEIERGA